MTWKIYMAEVLRVRVDVLNKNGSVESLLENPDQIILLDTNFLISPDRSNLGARVIPFKHYCQIWLDPLFEMFPNLAVHESVYDELIDAATKGYVDRKINNIPPLLKVFSDSLLSEVECALMQTYINKLSPYSKYIPERDNTSDRGEVKSLSYMAVKKLLYFAAHDSLPLNLIGKAAELGTGLEGISSLQMYEVIYFLYKSKNFDSQGLRSLYKYQYRLTKKETTQNPEWGEFIKRMVQLYGE